MDDHRSYNHNGEAFDVGETFSGVPFQVGVRAVREQTRANAAAADLSPLDASTLEALREVYDRDVRAHVHDRW